MAEIEELYQDIILELYRNPLNKHELKHPDSSFRDTNPLCGDIVEIQLKFNAGRIKEIGFQGQGCAISQASASMLTELVKGKKAEDAARIKIDDLLKELHLESLRDNAARIKCAALPLKVLKMALYKHLGKQEDVEWASVV